MSEIQRIYVGCAGWNLRRDDESKFPSAGSHLQRYSAVFPAVEINSSFYRPHRPTTYSRWAATVPDTFRFSAKFPKTVTHTHRLEGACLPLVRAFIHEVSHLGRGLGCLLLQLPPSLAFELSVVESFFKELRAICSTPIVCEPRHLSWFDATAESVLREYGISRAAVDPALLPDATRPSGAEGLAYYRLHGSPRMYYSEYSSKYLDNLATCLKGHVQAGTTWCIFDNTAIGAAARNALDLLSRLGD